MRLLSVQLTSAVKLSSMLPLTMFRMKQPGMIDSDGVVHRLEFLIHPSLGSVLYLERSGASRYIPMHQVLSFEPAESLVEALPAPPDTPAASPQAKSKSGQANSPKPAGHAGDHGQHETGHD